jgi:predicted nucleic acid-binding Zn ribbon protein
MRKSNEESLGSIIRKLLKEYHMEDKITEVRINALWEKVMGKEINRLTERFVLKEKVLFVYLRSAPLREELSMARSKIVELINKEFDRQVIKDIVFR